MRHPVYPDAKDVNIARPPPGGGAGAGFGTITRVYEYVDLPALFEAVAVLEGRPAVLTPLPAASFVALPKAAETN